MDWNHSILLGLDEHKEGTVTSDWGNQRSHPPQKRRYSRNKHLILPPLDMPSNTPAFILSFLDFFSFKI